MCVRRIHFASSNRWPVGETLKKKEKEREGERKGEREGGRDIEAGERKQLFELALLLLPVTRSYKQNSNIEFNFTNESDT